MSKSKGTVKFYNSQKAFGFITPKDGGKDVFVHASNCDHADDLREGTEVEYTIAQGKKGPEATEVTIL